MMHNRVKKSIAFVLLGLLLLNSGAGELLLHRYLVYRSDCFYNLQISRGLYDVHDLTEVKIPANMPGATDWGYENMNGEVRFANSAYNYVKIKITRHAIYLLCVPNYATTRLCGHNIINAENMGDIPVVPKQHVPYGKMITLGHFNFVFNRFEFSIPVASAAVTLIEPVDAHFNCNLDIPQPPPKAGILS